LGGQKLANTALWAGGATRKNLETKTQLDEPVECALGGDSLLLYKISNLLFFPLVRILCALRLEIKKNILSTLS
jgi:hypothetical protein